MRGLNSALLRAVAGDLRRRRPKDDAGIGIVENCSARSLSREVRPDLQARDNDKEMTSIAWLLALLSERWCLLASSLWRS